MPRLRNGFTLIEILIVMLIISIVAGVAAVTINSNQHKQFETFAKQLTNLITLAEQEAMLRPATIGLAFTPTSFQFYSYEQDSKTKQPAWKTLSSSAFKSRSLPNHTAIIIKVNEKNAPLDGNPSIIINSSGDISPFVIYIGKTIEQPYYQITGQANGEITSDVFHAEE